MEWQDWRPLDDEIRRAFGYEVERDRASAATLHAFVGRTHRFRELGTDVRNRRLAVVGCGPSLLSLTTQALGDRIVLACDGATKRLQELGVVPRVVVTDLDGDPAGLRWAAQSGARMVVHAHGDNEEAIRELVPSLGPLVYGTYATPPEEAMLPMESIGGFTDGDRAVVLAEALGAREATLFGFDFDRPPSRYSYRFDPATKMEKLALAGRVVEFVHSRGRLPIRQWMP